MPNQGGTHQDHVKAGQQSHKNEDKSHQASGNKNEDNRGGKGNFAKDPEKASEAGRKGGQH
ncbi:KGG domain-containing protein [Shinella sp.]|uniref:KGG domain-containing protein n=1 Tax=Shinella sp. TaxID=1870904 RepID=UPI00301C8B98